MRQKRAIPHPFHLHRGGWIHTSAHTRPCICPLTCQKNMYSWRSLSHTPVMLVRHTPTAVLCRVCAFSPTLRLIQTHTHKYMRVFTVNGTQVPVPCPPSSFPSADHSPFPAICLQPYDWARATRPLLRIQKKCILRRTVFPPGCRPNLQMKSGWGEMNKRDAENNVKKKL